MTYDPTLAQRIFPSRAWHREGAILVGAVFLVGLLAQCSVPLAPVPITGQTLGVLLVGGFLGFRRGVAAILLYLGLGTMGLPLFALGASGPLALAGPTGGYLIGFVLSAGTAGLLAEHGFVRNLPWALLTMVVASVPTFVLGLGWLSAYVPADRLLALGFWPFLPGAVIKIGLASFLTARRVR